MSELALIYPRPSYMIDSSGLSSTPKDEVDPEVLEADNIVSSTEAKSPAQVEVYDPHDEICMDMEFSPLTPVFPEFVPRSPEKPQRDSSPPLSQEDALDLSYTRFSEEETDIDDKALTPLATYSASSPHTMRRDILS